MLSTAMSLSIWPLVCHPLVEYQNMELKCSTYPRKTCWGQACWKQGLWGVGWEDREELGRCQSLMVNATWPWTPARDWRCWVQLFVHQIMTTWYHGLAIDWFKVLALVVGKVSSPPQPMQRHHLPWRSQAQLMIFPSQKICNLTLYSWSLSPEHMTDLVKVGS